MQKIFFLFAFASIFNACLSDQNNVTDQDKATPASLTLLTDQNREWQHNNLRFYPITADAALIQEHAYQANIKTMEEAMGITGFRITELKKFGKQQSTWYNGLTVINKSNDTIYMMSGDVIKGGKQDRVNEDDLMALPGNIKNINVFCVEQGRSTFNNPNATEAERKSMAFSGYYSIASPKVRKAVYNGNQSEVWGAVATTTSANNASSSTSTYTALDQASALNDATEDYIRFFNDKFQNVPNAVGLVAVCNGKVIGTEIFGHPSLFQKRLKSLVHSYATEAAMAAVPGASDKDTDAAQKAFEKVSMLARAHGKNNASAGRFDFGGTWIHLYSK